MVKLLTVESQSNIKVFTLIDDLYPIFKIDDWVKEYIFWELKLLGHLGYNLDLNKMANKKIIDSKTLYVAESSTEKKIIPNFLIEKNELVNDLGTLLDGLKLVGDFMDKTVLKPNNINFPISRNQFINSLK